MRTVIHLVALGLTMAIVVAGCTTTARPALDPWAADWTDVVAALPTIEELGSPPARDRCNTALNDLRAAADELLPSPDRAIDGPAREWLEYAEGVMFECSEEGGSLGGLDEAYRELAILEAEVASALRR